MDILAARKKAAERAKAAKEAQAAVPAPPESVPPVAPEAGPQPAPAVEAPPQAEASPAPAPEPAEAAQAGATPAEALAASEAFEMLAFQLGGEAYVAPIDSVKEVLKLRDITPVPHTPEYVLGVCSLRGAVLPIIDLSKRLGLATPPRDEKSRIVVLRLEKGDEAGLLVDRVRGVTKFSADAIKPPPETVDQGAGAEFIKGIARKDDTLYILLDVEKAVG